MGDYDSTALFADDPVPHHRAVTLLDQNADLKRGTILGRITASDKYTVSASAASDGSQIPRMVLAYDVPDPGADFKVAAYDDGSFVAEKIIMGAGWTMDTLEAALRVNQIPIRLKKAGAVKAS